jgi:hypothetical protein
VFWRVVFQLIGGALFVSTGENIFANRLLLSIPAKAPNIDPSTVLNTGASNIASNFPIADIQGIFDSYMVGLKSAWALGLALAVGAFVASFGPEMRSIKRKREG